MPLLDELLPRWDFRERHARVVAAPPERVWEAIHEVTLGEMPLARLLFRLRGMPQAADRPLLAQMLAGGFAALGEDPGHELPAGVVARMWRPGGDVQAIRRVWLRAIARRARAGAPPTRPRPAR